VVFIVRRPLRCVPGWTLKHGFFLIMGGFHLVEPVVASPEATTSGTPQAGLDVVNVQSTSTPSTQADAEEGRAPSGNNPETEGTITILTLEMLQELVKDPEFRIRITEEGIADRSKGDALFKIILTLQSSWFILRCIARHIQGLSLTQLELTTVALASLNGITFFLWWDKPLGVQDPVRVYMNRNLTDVERDVAGEVSDYRLCKIYFILTFDCSELYPTGLRRLPTSKRSLKPK